ncbi:probable inactive serine/threonine-protein kinase DDB_G0278909 [Episyrphus balteatus]|uniref:probable inactive serine/threonine-protein kinase DDB_G0278909 n=1 Tax=Episyrphus balteatus TaxID=286459 RepID=UPI002485E0D3|nr:probable inactive serine/threonine-protein kinase DDB_G0278909 [Episyrphus balteatus]XP_055848190.1 probable inactive serine/threonine-protein kinase DDB_G0278909 [Episyrphus balteatus]
MTTSPTNNNTCTNNHQKPMECIPKCSCSNSSGGIGSGGGNHSIGPRYSSLKSLKLNNTPNGPIVGGGFERKASSTTVKKLSCDATTSPGRIHSKDTDMTALNELRKKSDELIKLATGRSIPSPRRVVATRNAATSPNLDMRKLGLTERKPKEVVAAAAVPTTTTNNSQKMALEKSNSLGESKPTKQLRTTRSLSPRPPVRHQQAIIVSDENDIVSVKVSPNEDFELENGLSTRMAELSVRAMSGEIKGATNTGGGVVKKKHKTSKSEQTSPNIADFDTKFSYNQTNNKSTGCLVYVPSDPWLKMSDLEECKVNSLHKRSKNLQKMSKETRSLSRSKIEPLPSDPWIWRKPPDSANGGPRTTSNIKKSPKKEVFRQAKSFSATKFELGGGENTKSHRPKLQRCKSPLFIEDDFLPPPMSAPSSPFLKAPESQFSPPPPPFTATPPPPVPPHYVCNNSPVTSPARTKPTVVETQQQQQQQQQPQQAQRSFLDVVNPNLLQARHSFSSISQRDDELQLNIRRLSEQMRKTQAGSAAVITTTATGADFSDYLRQFRCSEAKKAAAAAQFQQQQQQPSQQPPLHHPSPKVTQNNLDSMLETTC